MSESTGLTQTAMPNWYTLWSWNFGKSLHNFAACNEVFYRRLLFWCVYIYKWNER